MEINDEKSLDIMELFYCIKKKWLMIVIITVVFTGLAFCRVAFLTKPIYSSYAKVVLNNGRSMGEDKDGEKLDLIDIYMDIIRIPDFINKVVDDQNLNVPVGKIIGGVSTLKNKIFLDISYTSDNPNEIKKVIDAIIAELPEYSKGVITNNAQIKVIEQAKNPKNPIGPDKFKNTFYGFAAGLIISLVIIFLQNYLDNSFKRTEDVERELGLIVVGEIPKLDKSESKKIAKKKKEKPLKENKKRKDGNVNKEIAKKNKIKLENNDNEVVEEEMPINEEMANNKEVINNEDVGEILEEINFHDNSRSDT